VDRLLNSRPSLCAGVHRESLAKKRLDLALKSFNAQDEPFIKNKIKKENAGHVLGVLNARPPSKYPPQFLFSKKCCCS
jgi:hypothetical protein